MKTQDNNDNNEAAKEKERSATKGKLDHKLTCQQQQWKPENSEITFKKSRKYVTINLELYT